MFLWAVIANTAIIKADNDNRIIQIDIWLTSPVFAKPLVDMDSFDGSVVCFGTTVGVAVGLTVGVMVGVTDGVTVGVTGMGSVFG